MVAEGMTVAKILADYPDLEADDVREAAVRRRGGARPRSVTTRFPAPEL
jgi:uncharacterized protein (DUF433 family)